MAEQMFRLRPTLRGYQELRDLGGKLDRWETMRSTLVAFLEQGKHDTYPSLLIQIALDEGDIDEALSRLKEVAEKDAYGIASPNTYGYLGSPIALEVARAAEETRPREARELHQQHVEPLIAQRGGQNYQQAFISLTCIRALYERLGEQEDWVRDLAQLREQHRNLRALKEELTNAGL